MIRNRRIAITLEELLFYPYKGNNFPCSEDWELILSKNTKKNIKTIEKFLNSYSGFFYEIDAMEWLIDRIIDYRLYQLMPRHIIEKIFDIRKKRLVEFPWHQFTHLYLENEYLLEIIRIENPNSEKVISTTDKEKMDFEEATITLLNRYNSDNYTVEQYKELLRLSNNYWANYVVLIAYNDNNPETDFENIELAKMLKIKLALLYDTLNEKERKDIKYGKEYEQIIKENNLDWEKGK
jgi:hypothetical protein